MASYTREYEYNGSSGTKLRVTLTTTATSIPNNTTTERVKVDFIHTGSSFNNTSYTASLNFNGTARTKTFSYSGAGTINLWNFTQIVPHNANGTKTANLTITDNRHNSPYTTTISVNDNFVLDTIPRGAVFTSVPDNIEIEKPFTIEINRRGASSVELGIYDTSGAGTFIPYFEIEETSFTFELTTTEKNRFYNDMPTSTSKKYRFYLKSDIGETIFSEKTFKIKAEIPSLPVFTHEDTNATTLTLTGSNQKYIQNYSDLKINITEATAFQGATITNYAIINGKNSKESAYAGIQYIDRVTSSKLKVIIQDSRGLISQSIITLDYIPYSNPTIQNFALNREIGTSTKADLITNGLYANVDFGAVANKIKKVEYRKKSTGDYGSWTDITAKVTYGGGLFNNGTNQQIDDFDFGTEYMVEIKVSDELSFNTKTAVVSKGLFTAIVDNKEYGSIGIGEMPLEETNSLKVKGNVYAPNLATQTDLGLKADKTYVDTELDKKANKLKYIRLQLANIDVDFIERVLNAWSVSETSGDFTSNSTSIIAPKNGLMKIGFSIFVRYFAFKDVQFYLTKNGTDIGRCACEVTSFNMATFIPMILPVEQGDVFQIRMGSTGWTSGGRKGYLASGNGTSWFQAEMIE